MSVEPPVTVQQSVVTAVTDSSTAPTMEVSTPSFQPTIAAPQVETREAPPSQSYAAEPPAPAPMPVREPEPAPEPVQQTAPAAEAFRAPAPPPQDPKEVLSTSGLVMIETDPSRSKSYTLEEEKVQLGRPRRERQKQAEESLMQVETKN
jgi:hypothetical protein